MADRTKSGKFAKGASGNPAGRPRKQPIKHRMPVSNRRAVFEVAETPVQITIDGETHEASAYRAVLMALAKKAMTMHTPSIRLFLDEVHRAAAVNGEQNEFTRWLIEEQEKLIAENDRLKALLPNFDGTGVVVRLADGAVVPASWYARMQEKPGSGPDEKPEEK